MARLEPVHRQACVLRRCAGLPVGQVGPVRQGDDRAIPDWLPCAPASPLEVRETDVRMPGPIAATRMHGEALQ